MNIQNEVQKIHAKYGVTEKAHYEIQKVCENYARIQIEKDRERIKTNIKLKHHCGTFKVNKSISYYQNGIDNITIDKESIDSTPIILD